jgi:hypothetical protein
MVNEKQLTARCTSQTHKLIQHAAKIGDQEGQHQEFAESPGHVGRLRQMYQAAITTLDSAHDPFSGSIRAWLADFEHAVAQNTLGAKELLYEVLDPSLDLVGNTGKLATLQHPFRGVPSRNLPG